MSIFRNVTILFFMGFSSLLANEKFEFDRRINEALEAFEVPGVAVGLVVNGEVVLAKGYGLRNIDKQLPVTSSTLFPIASCSKAFTAYAMGLLVNEGILNWDDHVIKYLPEFYLYDPETTIQVTIRDLLAHRTGLARHDPLWIMAEISRSSLLNIISLLEGETALRQEFRYNNLMYSVAGMVIEQVTGMSWEQAISQWILIPLSMDESNATLDELLSEENRSLPYANILGHVIQIPYQNPIAVNPGGGINASINDLIKWINLQLSSKAIKECHTLQISIDVLSSDTYSDGYGLGWFVGQFKGNSVLGHGGLLDGFTSEVTLVPEKGIGLAILTNSSTDGKYFISAIRNEILGHYLDLDTQNEIEKNQHRRKKHQEVVKKTFNEFSPSSIDLSLSEYLGEYHHSAYGIVNVFEEKNVLVLSYGRGKMFLHPIEKDKFRAQCLELLVYDLIPFVDITFIRNSNGNIEKIQIPFEPFRLSKAVNFNKL